MSFESDHDRGDKILDQLINKTKMYYCIELN